MVTRIEPYWLHEKDWLCIVEFLPEDDPEDRAHGAEVIGYYLGYAHLTDTRTLALVGDPVGHAYELLFSFSSPEGKQEFLRLLRSNDITEYDDELTPSVPTLEEIRDAQPIAAVLPEDVVRHANIVAATIMSAAGDDEPLN
jgi:hypothetical protein